MSKQKPNPILGIPGIDGLPPHAFVVELAEAEYLAYGGEDRPYQWVDNVEAAFPFRSREGATLAALTATGDDELTDIRIVGVR